MERDLTPRERDVLLMLRLGKSNSEIAESLDLSINTVKTHIRNVFKKLKVNNRIQAFIKAEEEKII